jgi:site-specific recombinase XerD
LIEVLCPPAESTTISRGTGHEQETGRVGPAHNYAASIVTGGFHHFHCLVCVVDLMDNDRIWTSYIRALKRKRISRFTIANYEVTMLLLNRHLNNVPLLEVCREDLEGFFDARLDEAMPSTVHGNYVNLRAFFNWMVAEEYITSSPLKKIDPPQYEYRTQRILTDIELKKLFDDCKGSRLYDKRDEAMLRLMSEVGGPRRGEIIAMTVQDVDFKHDLVHLIGKTGDRWIPYGYNTGVALDRYLRLRDRARFAHLPSFWLSYRGAVPLQTVWWIIRRHSLSAGIGAIHPHTLRHTAAHRAHEAGMSDQDMETLFGWAPGSSMTRAYGRAGKVVRAQNAARGLGLGDAI